MRGVEAKEAQDPQIVLANPRRGVADEADAPRLNVRKAVRVIVNLSIGRERQRVDGEVAPLRVLLEIAAKAHLGEAAVSLDVLAQRRHFKGRSRDDDRHRAMFDAGGHAFQAGVARGRKDGVGQSGRGEVDLVRRQTEQSVAHGAADHAGFRARLRESREQRREPGIVKQSLRRVHSKRPGCNFPFSIWAGT